MTVDDALIHKPCPEPNCKGDLVVKVNRETGHKFLGCNHFPTCKHTEEIPEYLRMIAAGAPTLFDL